MCNERNGRARSARRLMFALGLATAWALHAPASWAETCATANQGTAQWQNVAFAPQTGVFTFYVTATPSINNSDTLVALAQGPRTSWAGLAAIVRFNTANTIDVRDGHTYRADRSFSYMAGRSYRLRLSVDMTTKTYSVYLRAAVGGSDPKWHPLATDYKFRTEQQTVTTLDHMVAEAEVGAITACKGDVIVAWTQAQPGAGQWQNRQVFPNVIQDWSRRVTFEVRPMQANSDALIALSQGPQTTWNGLAAIVRFNRNGTIDVRNGDRYIADVVVPYSPNRTYRVHFGFGLSSNPSVIPSRYGVTIETPDGTEIPLARNYAFRTSQQNVTRLDNWVLEAELGGVRAAFLESRGE